MQKNILILNVVGCQGNERWKRYAKKSVINTHDGKIVYLHIGRKKIDDRKCDTFFSNIKNEKCWSPEFFLYYEHTYWLVHFEKGGYCMINKY